MKKSMKELTNEKYLLALTPGCSAGTQSLLPVPHFRSQIACSQSRPEKGATELIEGQRQK